MNSLFHALNIGTLAAWLSVAGFGTVGVLVPGWQSIPKRAIPETLGIIHVSSEITVGEESPPPTPSEALPSPPAMPDIASAMPLPEIPTLPTQPSISPTPQTDSGRKSANVALGKPTAPATQGNGGAGSSMSAKGRFRAGYMPAPNYPPYSRRNHQEGIVVIEFCVNPSGRVTAALAKNPCQWPLLNQTAIRTVLSWSFPPGGYDLFTTRMTFKLD